MNRLAWLGVVAAGAGVLIGGVAYAATRPSSSPTPPAPTPVPPAPKPHPGPVPPDPIPKVVWVPMANPVQLLGGKSYRVSVNPVGADPSAVAAFQAAWQALGAAGGTVTIDQGIPSDWPSDDLDPSRERAEIKTPDGMVPLSVPIALGVKVYMRAIDVGAPIRNVFRR